MTVAFILLLSITFAIVALLLRSKPEEKLTRERMANLVAVQDKTQAEGVDLGIASEKPQGLADRITARFQEKGLGKAIEKTLKEAGAKTSLGQFLLMSAGMAIGAGVFAQMMLSSFPLVLLAVVAGAGANFALLRWKAGRRLNKFNTALPDAIELMSRALKAGHSMASAIEVVAQQSPEPIGSEFGKCARQQRFGIPFREVMLALNADVPSQDLHFVITAILVQKETGGDLTEILDRTTEMIRERVKIQGEIRTYTAQGRLTGWILSGLPVGLLGMITLTSPSYSAVLFHDPLGQKLLYGAAGLIAIGGLTIRKIVDIKV